MKKELEEKWLAMCEKAQYWIGVSDSGNHIVPYWFDHHKFKETQKYIYKDISG